MAAIRAKSSSSGAGRGVEQLLADLANLNEGSIGRFRKRWKKSYEHYSDRVLLQRRDELRMLWESRGRRISFDGVGEIPLVEVKKSTQKLYEYWERATVGTGEPLEKFICDYWLCEEPQSFHVRWTRTEKRIFANPKCLPAVLAWGCVYNADYLVFCRNESCPATYFLANRRDQKYCSAECAKPAKKAAKLKWWHEHRGKKLRRKKSRKRR